MAVTPPVMARGPQAEIATTKPFTVSFPDRLTEYTPPASAAHVKEQIGSLATSLRVVVSPIEEHFSETSPMQFSLRGTFTGTPVAVEDALAAAKQIGSSIPRS